MNISDFDFDEFEKQCQLDAEKWMQWERLVARINARVLCEIREQHGQAFYAELLEIIQESEGVNGLLQIVQSPIGKYQEEGRLIPGIWVDQTTNGGFTGDTFAGTVCVKLKERKYLKFHYSM